MISVCIPYYDGMENGAFFLKRAIDSVTSQSYKDYEIVLTNEGSMPVNTNAAIKRAKGDIIKILYQDDYLQTPYYLEELAAKFKGGWLVTSCLHDDGTKLFNAHYPQWNDEIHKTNTIGSPSVLAMENPGLLFDEKLSWMLDADLYKRLYEKYGLPTILNDINVVIGIHPGQMTNLLSDEQKNEEVEYVTKKHE